MFCSRRPVTTQREKKKNKEDPEGEEVKERKAKKATSSQLLYTRVEISEHCRRKHRKKKKCGGTGKRGLTLGITSVVLSHYHIGKKKGVSHGQAQSKSTRKNRGKREK